MSRSTIVGSRELKTRLGRYLERVRRGETLLVTDRNEPVAELRPVSESGDPQRVALRKLAAKGVVSLPVESREVKPFKAIRARRGSSASGAVSSDRAERG